MNRRTFIATGSAALAVSRLARAEKTANAAKLARLSLMTLAFDNLLKVPGRTLKPTQTMDIVDVPEMFADRFGIHHIEFQYSHVPVSDPSVMNELLARIKKSRSQMTQINFEHANTISSPEPAQREEFVDLAKKWIDYAVTFKCPRVMIFQGALTPESKSYSIPTLKRVSDYAKSQKIKLCMETRARAPLSRDIRQLNVPYTPEIMPPPPAWVVDDNTRAAWMLAKPFVVTAPPISPSAAWTPPDGLNVLLLEHLKATGTYINIDIGGMSVETEKDMEDGIRALLPYTSGSVHINYRSNPGWDLPTVIRLFGRLGYKGQFTIEVNPGGDSYAVINGLREVTLANI